MKVEFFLGNSSYSGCLKSSGEIDTIKDFKMKEGEWESLTVEEKDEIVKDEMMQYVEMWYEER